ncbi:MAG: GDSL-type esterase/lipase family protein [Candidatus Falkowbacteria bacterium]
MSKRICVFGDSITWGAFDDEKGGWVDRLKLINFTQNEYVEIYNLGVSGDTTENVLSRIEVELSAREPEFVIFSIGSNDSSYIKSEDNNFVDLEKFYKNLNKLYKITKKFTKEIVFIGLTKSNEKKTNPIPWDQDICCTNENIKKYDLAIKNFCKENNLPFIEMFDLLKDEDLEDGLHPNAQGHEKMFQRVKDFFGRE